MNPHSRRKPGPKPISDEDGPLEQALSEEQIGPETVPQETGSDLDSAPEASVPTHALRPAVRGEKPPPDIVAPWHKYGTDESRGRRPNDFFAWWNDLKEAEQRRLMAYIYRHWPVGWTEKINVKKKTISRSTGIGKVAGEQPIKDLEDFKRRWGSGDYQILLNEQIHQKKTLTRCTISIRDTEFPPVIPDLAWLDLHDPANHSFIESLRLKGVQIPGDKRQTEREEEEDMAQTETVRELAGGMSEMAKLAVATAEKRGEERPVDTGSAAIIRGLDVMQQAGAASIAMVKEAAAALSRPAPQDPAESLGRIVNVVKDVAEALKPAKDDSAANLMLMFQTILQREEAGRAREADLHSKILGIQADQMGRLQAAVDKLLTEKQAQVAAAPAPGSLEELVTKLKNLKEGLRDLMGEEEGPSRKASLLEMAVENAPAIIQGLGALAAGTAAAWHNAAVARTGQGAPIMVPAPPQVVERPAEIPPPSPGPGPTLTDQQQREVKTMLEQLQALRSPLIRALDEGKTGDEFAEDLIALLGRTAYDQIREAGKETLYRVLEMYLPDVWQMARGMPQRFDHFIDEFLTADQLAQQEEAAPKRRSRPKVTVIQEPAPGPAA